MGRGGRRSGAGRPKGGQNKSTAAIKDAILGAFDEVGGQTYLAMVARADPKTFCTLLGKVLPMQVTGAEGGALQIAFKTVYESRGG